MLDSAFNMVLKMHSRAATLKRPGSVTDITTTCRITPSSYFRKTEGPSHTSIEGRQFVIPTASIAAPFTPILKRGDKIVDATLGSMAIIEINEMYDLGGTVMGYRVTVE